MIYAPSIIGQTLNALLDMQQNHKKSVDPHLGLNRDFMADLERAKRRWLAEQPERVRIEGNA